MQLPVNEVKQAVTQHLASYPQIQPEYFEIVDSYTLQHVQEVKLHEQVSLCIAAYLGDVRLIDNLSLNELD
jgi:pantoate--beta-alanine ligase